MTRKINSNKKKKSLFYITYTFRPYLDGKHKSIVRHLIKEFGVNYLENKEGEKILFATCEKKDLDGKHDLPCSCGCSKTLGVMEVLTEKELQDKYPQVWNELIKSKKVNTKDKYKICLNSQHFKLNEPLKFMNKDGKIPCLPCEGFSEEQLIFYKNRLEKVMVGESPPFRLRRLGKDFSKQRIIENRVERVQQLYQN